MNAAPRWFKSRIARWAHLNPIAYRWKVRVLARRCDYFLISFPKCGRTWLRLMLGEVLRRRYEIPKSKTMGITLARVTRPGGPGRRSRRPVGMPASATHSASAIPPTPQAAVPSRRTRKAITDTRKMAGWDRTGLREGKGMRQRAEADTP